MKVATHIPETRVAIVRFLDEIDVSVFGHQFLITQMQSAAEVIFLQGQDRLADYYNDNQLFCVIYPERGNPNHSTFSNVCVLNATELYGLSGVEKLVECIRKLRVSKGKNPEE